MPTSVSDLVEAVSTTDLPIVFETSDGNRFTLDPKETPYPHYGVLIVPIVDSEI